MLARELEAPPYRAVVLYRLQRVLDGIAAEVDGASLDRLRRLAGVRAVRRLPLLAPARHGTVPLVAAPAVWDAGAANARGEGVSIGVIDTGVDYLHVDLGGPGTGYEANDTTIAGDVAGFPGARVVGGYDFVGDAYDAGSSSQDKRVPRPDGDPMDCDGHGTHVAGIAAGSGVTAAGAEFPGPYTASLDLAGFRIAPGMAPRASLFALKVFGCSGTTAAVPAAIEWAVDPDGDGDLSDHLDVVNLSVGSPYGSPDDPVSDAVDAAAAAGVIVVAAAGNDGDAYFITGSPGTARGAISVAASVDASDVVDGLRIEAPAATAGVYPAMATTYFKWSAMTAPVTGQLAYPPSQNAGCASFDAGSSALIAGKIALLDWTDSCQLGTRVIYCANAGAIGVVVAAARPVLEGSYTGASRLPTVVIPPDLAQVLKGNLTAPVTASLDKQLLASVRVSYQGRVDTLGAFSSRGPASFTALVKPDLTAPGVSVFSAARGSGSRGVKLDGTSMAAPHVAGMMALLRQLHPLWGSDELKALAIDTAAHDLFAGSDSTPPRYGVGRVGAGRIDSAAAARSQAIARAADDPRGVALTFGALEVLDEGSWEKQIEVVNKGTSTLSLAVGYTPVTELPGVEVSLPGGAGVGVAGGGSTRFTVRLTATAAQMERYKEPTTDTTARTSSFWVSEETGYVTLAATAPDAPLLRVPLYAAARPASAMGTAESELLPVQPSASLPLTLRGDALDPGSFATADAYRSALTPLELAALSPDEPESTGADDAADIGWVGVGSDYSWWRSTPAWIDQTVLLFGIGSHARWSTPNSVGFAVYVDSDRDGDDDYLVTNAAFTSSPDEPFAMVCTLPGLSCKRGLYLNVNPPWYLDTVLLNSDVMVLPVTAANLGLSAARSSFDYRVVGVTTDQVDAVAGLHYDFARPGLDFGIDQSSGSVVRVEKDGMALPAACDLAAFLANRSRGALLLHHHNASGQRAQAIAVVTAADLGVSADAAPATARVGGEVAFTVGVANAGPAAATGITVAGAFSGSSELLRTAASQGSCGTSLPLACSLGDLAAGGAATITVVLKATSLGVIAARFSAAHAATDPVAANDEAAASCTVGRQPRRRVSRAP